MKVVLLISIILNLFLPIYSASILGNDFELIGRKRNLQKNLLRNLQARQAGATVQTRPLTHTFVDDTDVGSGFKSEARTHRESANICFLSCDLRVYILSFLTPFDLLTSRQLSRSFCNLSNDANYMKLREYNPYFVLEENWMNLAMRNFLFKHFENGRLNEDELLMTIKNVIFKMKSNEIVSGKNPDTVNILLFLYEYQNGSDSHMPLSYNDLNIEIIRKLCEKNLPKSLEYLEELYDQYLNKQNMNGRHKILFKEYLRETVNFLQTKPSTEEIMMHFDFDPESPIEESLLKSFPLYFQVAMLELILPCCNNAIRFLEAINMTTPTMTFSPIILEQLEQKFPDLVDAVFIAKSANTPVGLRARRHHKNMPNNASGLDYLLSRNTANPFDLQELLALDPDIYRLMKAFSPKNTLTLTEIDMVAQMKEAGLFAGLPDQKLFKELDMVIQGVHRLRLIRSLHIQSKII